ncbi:hypothetical protein B0H16DRAFT_1578212 [Mycena metata]|uniref:DUF5648 domain-containing protein n=1 Tax=Mycena metata TaxID=1033252 RepID=A0AAD7I427_9AGAR|nr:hypothetical protein B0H16DRAFT_1578212 [Mycena metata]
MTTVNLALFLGLISVFALEIVVACDGAAQSSPLYRGWNPTLSDHFYTPSLAEINSAAPAWNSEGIRAGIFTGQVSGSVRFIRMWNGVLNDHFYTTNATEAANAAKTGYAEEDQNPIYIYPTQLCGSTPLYRLYAAAVSDHFYTVDPAERDGAEQNGWAYEWVAGYVFPPPTVVSASSAVAPTSTKSSGSGSTPQSAPPTVPSVPSVPSVSSSSAPSAPSGIADPVLPIPSIPALAPTTNLPSDTTPLADSQPSSTAGSNSAPRLRFAPVTWFAVVSSALIMGLVF